MKHKDGRTIQSGSSEDFHEIDGKRGIIVIRKSDDPSIMLPLNKIGSSLYENTHVNNDAPNLNKIINTKITRSKNENLAIKLLDSKNSFVLFK